MDERVVAFDIYNMSETGGVSKALNSVATDSDHIPVVCIEGNGSRPSHRGGGWRTDGRSFTLNTVDKHSVCYAVENHPNDSRIKVDDEGIVQTLSSRMGTGGGNTPIVLIALDAFKTQEEDGGTNAKRSLR